MITYDDIHEALAPVQQNREVYIMCSIPNNNMVPLACPVVRFELGALFLLKAQFNFQRKLLDVSVCSCSLQNIGWERANRPNPV